METRGMLEIHAARLAAGRAAASMAPRMRMPQRQ